MVRQGLVRYQGYVLVGKKDIETKVYQTLSYILIIRSLYFTED